MARAKKETALTPEERLQAALVPDWEWPYKLPENWCWVKASAVARIYTGNSISEKIKADKYAGQQEGLLFIATKDVGFDNAIDYETDIRIPDYPNFKIAPANTALLCIEGGSAGRKVGFVNREVCFGNKLCAFAAEKVNSKFIYYILQSQYFIQQFNNRKHGLIGGVSVNDLAEIGFPLSPLAEQQRIVDRIESLFAKLDEAKEKAQAVVDSFETRRAAILHKAFTGELTAKWREEHYATDNTVLMDIKNYSSSWSAKEKDLLSREQAKSEVVVLDNGHKWIRCTIGAVGRVTNGSTPLRKEPKYWSGKIPWISSGEVRNNIIESSNECISEEGYANSSVKLLPIGTVLIAMIGEGKTRGQSAILNIEATINQNVAAIVVEHNCVLPYYIWYWLQMNYAKNREKGSGSGPQALNCQRVRELDFFVPSLKEQKEVVNILRKALAKEQQSKEAAEAVLDQIDLMKKSILARAFRGEMGTNDPSEESAVELLKRGLEKK